MVFVLALIVNFFAQKLHNAARNSEGITEFLKLTPDGKSTVQLIMTFFLFVCKRVGKKAPKRSLLETSIFLSG